MKPHPDFRKLLLPKTATIRDSMRVMSAPTGAGITLIVDSKRVLLGVVVDSDLRKAMLKGHGLDTPLHKVMNRNPFTLPHDTPLSRIRSIVGDNLRAIVPLVDKKGRVMNLVMTIRQFAAVPAQPNWVVLMVGGFGQRLQPLTKKKPKPLLPVGDKPILETIVKQFTAAGFTSFIFALNHHADQIRRHFGDGGRFGADINYVCERKRMGTAGALSLLKRSFSSPLIVMNGDVLTKIDFRFLLEFHTTEKNLATVCVREYDFQVPYGVVEIDGHHMLRMEEKPTRRLFVNAGIYALEPEVLRLVPRNRFYNMPSLIERVRKRRRRAVGCFPIREYWIDVGRIPDYRKAQGEYEKFF